MVRFLPGSVRTRVTVVFTLGAVVAVAISLSLLYGLLDRQLTGALEADLATRSDDLAAAVERGDTAVIASDPLAQLYGPDGTLLAGSTTLGSQRLLTPAQVRAVTGPVRATRRARPAEEEAPQPVWLLSRQLPDGLVLTVGVSAAPLNAARERLVAVLLLAAPVLVGLLAAAGWFVVRAALRPVDVLTREAAAISSVETDRRLPPVPGDDEIARLAHTLDGMLDRLRAAFARERAFVDDASHELRTPIAVLRGELELALSSLDEPDEVRQSLRAALGETERLSRLAEDLLLLAREQAGGLAMRREPVDLYALATAEAERLRSALPVTIEVSGAPATVPGDRERLGQVLANLARNSAAAGASRVSIQVGRDERHATVAVSDDGGGFGPEVIDKAFERFVRGDDARTRGGFSTGLGLSIVRAVVAAHGGSVAAHNQVPPPGAVVTVRLPVT